MAYVYSRKQATSNQALNPSKFTSSRSSGGSSSSSSSPQDLPTSNLENITPTATVGMTEDSVRQQTTVVRASGGGSSRNYTSINDLPMSTLENPTPIATVQPRQTTSVQRAQTPVYTPSYDFGMYGRGTITASTPDLQKKSNLFSNTLTSAKEGVFDGGLIGNLFNRDKIRIRRGGIYDDVYDAASLGSFVLDVATIGGVGRAISGATAVRKGGEQILKTTAKNIGNLPKILQYPVNILGSTAIGVGTAKTVETGLKIRTGTPLIYSPEEKKAFEAGRKAQKESIKGFFANIGFDLGLGGGDKDSFYNAMRKSLLDQNVSNAGAKAETGIKQSKIRDFSTLSGILASGAFSEFTGQAQITTALNKGEAPTFWNFAKNIAPSGAGEGFSGVVLMQENVGDTRKFFTDKTKRNLLDYSPYQAPESIKNTTAYKQASSFAQIETTRFGEALGGAGVGIITSGGLGGWIGSSVAKGKKALLPKAIGYFADPTEYPSDLLEGVVTKRVFKTPRVPVFTEVPTGVFSFSDTAVTLQTQTQTQGKPKGKTPSNVNIFSNTPVNNLVATMTEVPEGRPRPRSKTPNNVNPFDFVPADNIVPVDNTVPADTDTNTYINIFSDVPVQPNVPVNTIADTFTNVPVFTNRINAPLPLIPTLNFGGGGGGGVARRKGTRYIDELAASQAIFKNIMGIKPIPVKAQPRPKPRPKPKSKSKAKKVYKEERKRTPLNRFNRMVFG